MTDAAVAGPPRDPAHWIDLAATWASLDAATQQQVGITALALAATWAQHDEQHFEPPFEAADAVGIGWLEEFGRARFSIDVNGGVRFPDLAAAFGIAQCRVCGCTDRFACSGGCGWHTDDLCSACAKDLPPCP